MKVRICDHCPYSPADLGPHYAQSADELCCIACPMPISNMRLPPHRDGAQPQARGIPRLPERAALPTID